MRLGSRFTLLFGVLAAIAAFCLVLLVDSTLRRAVEDRVSERITRELDHLADDLGQLSAVRSDLAGFLRRSARVLSCRITFIGADGRVLEDTDLLPPDVAKMDNHSNRPEVRAARVAGKGQSLRFSATEQEERFYFASRLRDSKILRLSVSAGEVRELERAYLWSARFAVFGACLLLFVIGAAASRRFSKPIAELTQVASAIAAGETERDLPRSGGEEVQLLSAALQRMKDSLKRGADRAETERRLAALVFARLPDGLVVLDSKLHVLESNEEFSRMIGAPAPTGRALYDVVRHRPLYEVFETALRSTESIERTIRFADGVVWQVAVVPLPEGFRASVVGVLRDITHLERTESMRRTFIADVSHELRTPIASIAAASETLAEGETNSQETAHLVELIRRQSERMRELIDDLMDLAQIESGGVELYKEKLSLPALLREVSADFTQAAADKNINLVVEADESITVEADRRRFGQVVRNLVDNAIKFSPEGGTVILRSGRELGETIVSVSDEGRGIPRTEQDKIFQRFYQVDRSRSKVRPGTGLGLAIVKHLVQLHGAHVSVRSELGQGSTFQVRFPKKEDQVAGPAPD